jgi:hypothetical protein
MILIEGSTTSVILSCYRRKRFEECGGDPAADRLAWLRHPDGRAVQDPPVPSGAQLRRLDEDHLLGFVSDDGPFTISPLEAGNARS